MWLDAELVWANCLTYNVGEESAPIRKQAEDCRAAFHTSWRRAKLPEDLPAPANEQWLFEDKLPATSCVKRSKPLLVCDWPSHASKPAVLPPFGNKPSCLRTCWHQPRTSGWARTSCRRPAASSAVRPHKAYA